MISYKFYLRNNQDTIPAYVEVDEPIGWDGVEFTLQRSDLYEGLENLYSDDLTFNGLSWEILSSAFDLFGFDALLDFKIETYSKNVLINTIETVINMSFYRQIGNEITVKLESSSFERKFKNRIETKVNFNDENSVEGIELTAIESFDLGLHSKEIIVGSERVLSDDYNLETYKYSKGGAQLDYAAPPYNILAYSTGSIASGSGFTLIEKAFYFQYDFSEILINDENIGDFYGLLYSASETANPYLKVKYSGNINIDLNFNVSARTQTDDNSSNLLGLLAKINGCSDSDTINGLRLTATFFFELYIRIGSTIYIYPVSSDSRTGCTEEYFGDLIGKINWEGNSNDPADGDTITDKPDKYRFVNVALNQTFPCNAGDDIYVLLRLRTSGEYEKRLANTDILVYAHSWIDKENSYLKFSNTSIEVPSIAKSYLIYESFNRVCEAITDTPNAFRSNFFGRTNSSPQTYGLNGCSAWVALTNGLNIRRMLDKDFNLFPFITNFFDLFKSCNAIWNLGCRVEQDEDGNYYIRVEPKEYFYDNTEEIFTINQASNIEKTFAVEKLYNDVEIGYDKWEIENINGLDEFCTKHFYEIPLINVKQKLNQLSPYIASGYIIEMTRRVQYSDNPTSDWQFDNDNFIIATNNQLVISDKYTSPPVAESYDPGQVAERNENYIQVTNLISPESCYNLRLSPGNMILNWFKSLAPAILLKPDKRIKFVHGYANITLFTEKIDSCSIAAPGGFKESQHIQLSSTEASSLENIALFTPVYINFEYPIDFCNFITIKDQSNKLIRVNCGQLSYFGFIKELKFKPGDETANFKILLTGCVGGGFDSGFDSGFEIGTC